jgi:hypothetical protein
MTDITEDQFEDVTDEDVASAEQEAREAEELVASLEHRVESGDDTVSVDDIVAQENLGRFAKLRATATRNKAERARVKRRLLAARDLRDEMLAEGSGIGARLTKHLRTIAKAEAALIAEATAHNAKVTAWKDRAHQLGIPATTGSPIPPAEDGQLAVGTNSEWVLNAAGTRFVTIDIPEVVNRHNEATSFLRGSVSSTATAETRERQYRALEALDVKQVENPSDQFWRSTVTGAVITLDRDPTADEVAAGKLVRITRAEAYAR